MTEQDAKKVVSILMTADYECQYCVNRLMCMFVSDFPDHSELAKTTFRERYKEELNFDD